VREEKGGGVMESKVREALLLSPSQGEEKRRRVGGDLLFMCVR